MKGKVARLTDDLRSNQAIHFQTKIIFRNTTHRER